MNEEEKQQSNNNESRMKSITKEGEEMSSEERMKIIEQGRLKEICKVIHSSLEGEMNQKKQYLILLGCEAASILLEDNKESFRFAIESGGIIDQIISLLNKLPIENIIKFHLLPIFYLVDSSNSEQRKILAEKGFLKVMIKILDSEDELVLDYSTFILMKIIYGVGELEGEGKPNPLLKEMEKDETLTKLIEIFRNDKYKDKNINTQAACSFGYLFQTTQIPSEIGSQIIIHLKYIIINTNSILTSYSHLALCCLAECEQNHHLILSDEFLQKLNEFLNDDKKEQCYEQILQLIIKLFKYGNNETKINIQNQISLNKLIQLSTNDNKEISNKTVELLKLFDENKNKINQQLTEAFSKINIDQQKEIEKEELPEDQMMQIALLILNESKEIDRKEENEEILTNQKNQNEQNQQEKEIIEKNELELNDDQMLQFAKQESLREKE